MPEDEQAQRSEQPEEQAAGGEQDAEQSPPSREESLLEWATAAAGGVLVLGAITYLLFQGFTQRQQHPVVTARAGEVRTIPGGFEVELEVRNQGDATAGALVVEGELSGRNGPVETSEATFDFVPGRSVRTGGLFFTKDPRRHELKVRPLGYQDP